jgi:peptide/nickel transport system permease protein
MVATFDAETALISTTDAHRSVGRLARLRGAVLWVLLGLVFALGIVGLIVQQISSLGHLYLFQNLEQTFEPPLSHGHLLGTDNLGRDLGWRILCGLGVSLAVGVGVAILSVVLGLSLGIFAGFFGRAADSVATVAIDVTWAFPAILLAIVFAGWFGPGLLAVILALSLTGWASFARIVRGEVLSMREREYVAAARVLGVSRFRISIRHMLPNLIPTTIVMSVYFVSTSIIAEAGLSFLGLGAQAPTPSLGIILSEGRDYLNISWWPVVLSGLTLAIVVLLLNTIGDQLRDRLDPRGRNRP